MSDVIERRKVRGYTVEIWYDEDTESPRDDCGNFLFLGFPHRNYKIGDETFDPSDGFECTECAGSGCLCSMAGRSDDDHAECPKCEGSGTIHASNLNELMLMVQEKYKAHLVLPVGMIDHSGVSYYIGGGAHWCDPGGWDSGTCGLILDTPETLAERGFAEPLTEEWLREGMTAEIQVYSDWASGACYGITVLDRNGDYVESCGGFIGHEWAEENIEEMVPDEPQPPVLYDVRLTKAEIDSIIDRLGNQHEAHHLPVIDKLQAIDTSEEDADV